MEKQVKTGPLPNLISGKHNQTREGSEPKLDKGGEDRGHYAFKRTRLIEKGGSQTAGHQQGHCKQILGPLYFRSRTTLLWEQNPAD